MRLHPRSSNSFNHEGAARSVLTIKYRELAEVRLEIGAWMDEMHESSKEYIFSPSKLSAIAQGGLAGVFNAQEHINELRIQEARLISRINRLCKRYVIPANA